MNKVDKDVLKKVQIKNKVPSRLKDEEAKEIAREIFKYETKVLGRTEKAADASAAIFIDAVNETADEFGED